MEAIYRAFGHRAVRADGPQAAAMVFFRREARKDYGRGAVVHTPRLDSWTESGRTHTYEAFAGRRIPGGASGRNLRVTVTRESAP